MRTVIVTGSAGSGTSSVALGLAHRLAGEGRRTVLVRCPSGSGAPPPVTGAVAAGATVRDVDPLAWGQAAWEAAGVVRRLIGPPWSDLSGYNVLPLPGLRELAWWAAMREVWRGPWDCVVVDAGPVGPALQWLTLPDAIVGLLRRAWPMTERTGAAAGRLEVGSWHLRAMAWLDCEAAELADQLRSGATSTHLVMRPRQHELRGALDAMAPLALFDLAVTDVVVNRVAARRAYDRAVLDRLPGQLPGVAVRPAADHRGQPDPAVLGREIYPDLDPAPRKPRPRVGRSGELFEWHWPLPFADPARTTAVVDGDDLVLTVGSNRRVVPLPSVLRRCRLVRATTSGSGLLLQFVVNPDVWPETREAP